MSRHVTYHGPIDEVEIEVAPNLWQPVKRGASVEVSDDLADSLLDQPDNWKAAKVAAAKKD